MPTLNASYENGTLVVTGGDNNGPDVTVAYGVNETIVWNRVGTNFKFKDLTFAPDNGPFTKPVIQDDSMTVLNDNTNASGKDITYKYTITYRDSAGELKQLDPKVINKSRINLALESQRSAEKKTT